jgi:hypothetical protein
MQDTTPNEAHNGVQPLLRSQEAADLLRLSRQRLAEMRLEGSGPTFIKAGRTVLYALPDLLSWIATNRRRSTSQTAAAA